MNSGRCAEMLDAAAYRDCSVIRALATRRPGVAPRQASRCGRWRSLQWANAQGRRSALRRRAYMIWTGVLGMTVRSMSLRPCSCLSRSVSCGSEMPGTKARYSLNLWGVRTLRRTVELWRSCTHGPWGMLVKRGATTDVPDLRPTR